MHTHSYSFTQYYFQALPVITSRWYLYKSRPPQQQHINLDFTNIRSIKNKSEALNHHIIGHNTSIFAVTETWLREDETPALLADITPSGYQLYHKPQCSRGGGVGFIVDKNINCHLLESQKDYNSFEHIMLNVVQNGEPVNFVCIYRPPGTKTSFLEDFSELISHLTSLKHTFVIVGDINIDPKTHTLSNRYTSLLEEWAETTCGFPHTHSWEHLRSPDNTWTFSTSQELENQWLF